MTVLVFGKTGQVATELQRQANLRALDRTKADLTDPAACAEAILRCRPDAVINAAAYTAVDRAESDEGTATLVNGGAPGAMAGACADLGIPFIHLSTDYVFDGSGTAPWSVDAPTGPLGAYGRSKLAGEAAIQAAGGTSVILRTSWVVSAHGSNFVKTMLRLGAERDRLTIVADQVGGPTPAQDIAAACLSIAAQLRADRSKSGTYHFSGAPDVSWADFAREIFLQAGISCEVVDIPTSAFPTPAKRPSNSRMDCSDTTERFGISRPDWRSSLSQIIQEIQDQTQ
ncbi:dTDP-4-dehydrorhamnose reductase [Nioella sediminis]|jgi:dTDP-4-dehydrorhamnose reductase|uniref:dTDP-4-dehydrorhamnose reductase n=1 Tax=Nioella sediminis TaxID=1912092 RepID=UPI0008FD47EC|nr:dTDP-4-dehydrorhamnose reductase [Nioella sediminis]TBX21129.1 dTDP-4-dehydrorhamnose reductase [Roseovarius sp. JS7-11]